MDLGIIAIVVAVIFISYRIGAIKFAQTTSARGIDMTDRMLETMDFKSQEKSSKDLGKVMAKLDDESIARATPAELKARFKVGFANNTKTVPNEEE